MDPGASGDVLLALVALSCLYGHIFSPYLKFHGGKGIATGVGVLFGFCWPLALLHLGIFIILVAITKYVSVGSIATAPLFQLPCIFCSPRSAWLRLLSGQCWVGPLFGRTAATSLACAPARSQSFPLPSALPRWMVSSRHEDRPYRRRFVGHGRSGLLADSVDSVAMWAHSPQTAEGINSNHVNPRYP